MRNDRLNMWFGLSYSSFLVLPRVLMQDMPDEWQEKMAELLEEADDVFPNCAQSESSFTVRSVNEYGKMVKMPKWLMNYRHPSKTDLDRIKNKR